MIKKTLEGLIEKKVVPKLFGIVFSSKGGVSLSMVTAYSLEEAHHRAIVDLKKQFPSVDFKESKIVMYLVKDIAEILEGFVIEEERPEVASVPILPKEKTIVELLETGKSKFKNELMQKIVKGKDIDLLEKNKNSFSDAEYKYLAQQIKSKKI